jgi:hypothetical protein
MATSRSFLQLGLFATSPAPPALVPVPTPPPPPAPAVSKTRLLVDAIHEQLPHARVLITDNRTILLSQSVKDGVRTVRAHQMFLDAPEHVRRHVAHFLAHGDRKSGAVVDAFVDEQQHLLQMAARPLPKDAHKGRVHDLMPIFVEINRGYFGDRIDAEIGWGQPGKPWRRQRRSITFGSWDSRQRRIVIHPVLDLPEVPRLAVERVVHHEMLHAHHGDARDGSGRRVVHSRAFRADEARFHGAKEADAWFDAHLDALLRWRPGQSLSRTGKNPLTTRPGIA